MGLFAKATGLAAAFALAAGASSAAEARQYTSSEAGKLRELDIMLMVTSLRCRLGEFDYQSDYSRFSRRHLQALKSAARRMRSDLARSRGARGANRALDRASTRMANRYGNGHPWLDCAALGKLTRQLASSSSDGELLKAADQYLSKG